MAPASSVAGAGKEGVVVTNVDPRGARPSAVSRKAMSFSKWPARLLPAPTRSAMRWLMRARTTRTVCWSGFVPVMARASSRCRWDVADPDLTSWEESPAMSPPPTVLFRGAGLKPVPTFLHARVVTWPGFQVTGRRAKLPSVDSCPPPSEGLGGRRGFPSFAVRSSPPRDLTWPCMRTVLAPW